MKKRFWVCEDVWERVQNILGGVHTPRESVYDIYVETNITRMGDTCNQSSPAIAPSRWSKRISFLPEVERPLSLKRFLSSSTDKDLKDDKEFSVIDCL